MSSEVGGITEARIVKNGSFPLSKSFDEAYPNPSLIKKVWMFFCECIYRDFSCVLRCIWYRIVYFINPHKYCLNPNKIEIVQGSGKTAKIVLLAHGDGGHPSNFFSLAKTLYEKGIKNVYTVNLKCEENEGIPVKSIAARLQEISQEYLKKGYHRVEISIVGHSFGAITAAAYIYRVVEHIEHAKISKVISLSGRLKYAFNPFFWFCEGLKSEIKITHKKIEAHLKSQKPEPALYTIWGDQDGVVPKESVHIQNDNAKEYTVERRGHLGVLFDVDAQRKIAEWITG